MASCLLKANAWAFAVSLEENKTRRFKRSLQLQQRLSIGVRAILVAAHRICRHPGLGREIADTPVERCPRHSQLLSG